MTDRERENKEREKTKNRGRGRSSLSSLPLTDLFSLSLFPLLLPQQQQQQQTVRGLRPREEQYLARLRRWVLRLGEGAHRRGKRESDEREAMSEGEGKREGAFFPLGAAQKKPKNEEEKTLNLRRFFSLLHKTTKQGAPINEADHCGDPPLVLAAGNGKTEEAGEG